MKNYYNIRSKKSNFNYLQFLSLLYSNYYYKNINDRNILINLYNNFNVLNLNSSELKVLNSN